MRSNANKTKLESFLEALGNKSRQLGGMNVAANSMDAISGSE